VATPHSARVFTANIRYNNRLTSFSQREREKVNTQWNLDCRLYDIEKLAKTGYEQ
jgi:hypothetical protein